MLHGSSYVYEPFCHKDKRMRTMSSPANLILDNSCSCLSYFIHEPLMFVVDVFVFFCHILIYGYGHDNLQCFIFSTMYVVAPQDISQLFSRKTQAEGRQRSAVQRYGKRDRFTPFTFYFDYSIKFPLT